MSDIEETPDTENSKETGAKGGVFSNIGLKGKIFAGTVAPLSLLVILGVVTMTSVGSIVETNRWVEHTHNVLGEADSIVASAVDMETGMRGYLLAGKEAFLEPYNAGGEKFLTLVNDLQETVSDNPQQVALLDEVRTTISGWQTDVTEPTIALRRQIG
ncbi:MAG: CHASE3 domain-containing protein, partial [Alphaproteobacteria bacterium]|nr:CHASE3 domain-containing protein [Alphaproteobacteria bacterium]